MSKLDLGSKSKPFCDCKKQCGCNNCPNVLQKLNLSPSSHVCDHGTRPKCACDEAPQKVTGPCQLCSMNEPEPIADPKRTQSMMAVLKHDNGCHCKAVTRAVRADVHRYLGMVDRDHIPLDLDSTS